MKNKVKAELTTAKEFYDGLKFAAIYADCWTSSRNGNGFVGVELSYVRKTDDGADIRTVCLSCRLLQGSHDGPRIAKLIEEVVIFYVVLFVSTLISFLIIRFWPSTISLSIMFGSMYRIWWDSCCSEAYAYVVESSRPPTRLLIAHPGHCAWPCSWY
jgi:hypothetical protein